ncbi:MAG: hypothetical protein ABJP67_14495 [Nitratireductor sp.]|uniref:hypothetical protein n=1 Tax=Bauldia litoralis TaxID=665467 RepID=UPI0032665AB2
MRWYRAYVGMMRDAKIVGVAARSRQPVERVGFVWACILESACERQDSGVYHLDQDEMAYFLRCDPADIAVVLSEMQAAGMVADGVVCRWSERQFESDRDPSAAERQRRKRERDKQGRHAPVTRDSRGPEAESDTDSESEAEELDDSKKLAAAACATEATSKPIGDGELLNALLGAAGLTATTMPSGMRNVGAIHDLLGDGFDLAGDVLPVVRRLGPLRKAKSWKYFVPAIREAEAGEQQVPADRFTERVDDEDPRWPALEERYCTIDPATDQPRPRPLRGCPRDREGNGWRFKAAWVAELTPQLAERSDLIRQDTAIRCRPGESPTRAALRAVRGEVS